MDIADVMKKVDWSGVKSDVQSLVGRFTKATDTPLDDLMAPYAMDALWELVKPLVAPPLAKFAASPTSAFSGQTFAMPLEASATEDDGGRYTKDEIVEKIKARGYAGSIISSILLMVLLQLGKRIVDKWIDKWFPPKN